MVWSTVYRLASGSPSRNDSSPRKTPKRVCRRLLFVLSWKSLDAWLLHVQPHPPAHAVQIETYPEACVPVCRWVRGRLGPVCWEGSSSSPRRRGGRVRRARLKTTAGCSRREAVCLRVCILSHTAICSLLVRLLVVVLVLVAAAAPRRRRRRLIGAAVASAAALLWRFGALAAVAAAVLLVQIGQRASAKGQVVVFDRDDVHPGGSGLRGLRHVDMGMVVLLVVVVVG